MAEVPKISLDDPVVDDDVPSAACHCLHRVFHLRSTDHTCKGGSHIGSNDHLDVLITGGWAIRAGILPADGGDVDFHGIIRAVIIVAIAGSTFQGRGLCSGIPRSHIRVI